MLCAHHGNDNVTTKVEEEQNVNGRSVDRICKETDEFEVIRKF